MTGQSSNLTHTPSNILNALLTALFPTCTTQHQHQPQNHKTLTNKSFCIVNTVERVCFRYHSHSFLSPKSWWCFWNTFNIIDCTRNRKISCYFLLNHNINIPDMYYTKDIKVILGLQIKLCQAAATTTIS